MDSSDVDVAVAVTNEKNKVSINNNYIHDDLASYVLSKLPIKSLKRFECVRKSWSILFQNSHFMTMYRNHFISNHNNHSHSHHTYLLIHHLQLPDDRYHAELHLLSNERFENSVKLNLPPPFQEDILGSTCVNGILCLEQLRLGGAVSKLQFVLCNPATDEFLLIPPAPDEYESVRVRYTSYHFTGFGYDQVRDDFKVFQYVSFYHLDCYPFQPDGISHDPLFQIYSLRSNSWRILDINLPNWHYSNSQVYLDGVCHWLGIMNEHCLMSFDLSGEVLFTTPMDENSDFQFNERHLVVLNGSIALISCHYGDTTFHISILGELGVKESWIKLFTFGPIPSIEWPPIGVGKKGYIFFRKKDDELAWVDLSTQIIEEIGVKGERSCCCNIGVYKENLLPIGGFK